MDVCTMMMAAIAPPLSPSSDEGDGAGAIGAGVVVVGGVGVTDSEIGSVAAMANSVKCITATFPQTVS